jgi:hypothetical protein
LDNKKRTKKPNVKPEQRQNWFERNERGESVPHIAEADDYDERTVRRHIELAKQKREVQEARSAVLRNALERHYRDMSSFVERLNSRISGSVETSLLPDDDLIEAALRQHLPRSPIWGNLSKWQRLREEIPELRNNLDMLIKDLVQSNDDIISLTNAGFDGIVDGTVDVLKKETEQWLGKNTDYTLKDSLIMEPAGENLVDPCLGAFHMGIMDKKSADQNMRIVRGVIGELESCLIESDEYHDLEKIITEIERLSRKLRKELAVIRLRRIVTGRCKFCPL